MRWGTPGAKPVDGPQPGQETPRLADYGHLPSRGELELVRAVRGGPLGEAGAALLAAACRGRAEEGAGVEPWPGGAYKNLDV